MRSPRRIAEAVTRLAHPGPSRGRTRHSKVGLSQVRDDGPSDLCTFAGMPLEGLLAAHVDEVQYSQDPLGRRGQWRETASIVVRTLISRRAPETSSAKVLHIRSSEQEHLAMISSSVAESLGEEVAILSADAAGRDAFLDAIWSSTLFDVVRSFGFAMFRRKRIWQCLRDEAMPEGPTPGMVVIFWRQLLLGLSMRRFLERQNYLECVTADFDRGYLTGPWFAAASSLSIPSCSFQHGVIFPSGVVSGFSPLVADAIGVWGSPAREQLIREGVDPKRIHVVGNAALPIYVVPQDHMRELRENPKPGVPAAVVLALSGWDSEKNRALVEMFSAIKRRCDKEDIHFLVRLHPAYPTDEFQWIRRDFGLDVADRAASLEEFIRSTSVLLVADSTFGIVGLANGIPTGRAEVKEERINSGTGYVEYLGIPEVSCYEDFQALLLREQVLDRERVMAVIGDPVGSRITDMIASLRLEPGKRVSRLPLG